MQNKTSEYENNLRKQKRLINEKLSTKGNGVKKIINEERKTRTLMTYRNTLSRHTKQQKSKFSRLQSIYSPFRRKRFKMIKTVRREFYLADRRYKFPMASSGYSENNYEASNNGHYILKITPSLVSISVH